MDKRFYINNDCYIDFSEQVLVDTKETHNLTRQQLKMLECFISNVNTVISTETFLDCVWEYDDIINSNQYEKQLVRDAIKSLRDLSYILRECIETKVKIGYKFNCSTYRAATKTFNRGKLISLGTIKDLLEGNVNFSTLIEKDVNCCVIFETYTNEQFLKRILPEITSDTLLEGALDIEVVMQGKHDDDLRCKLAKSFAEDTGYRIKELTKKCKRMLEHGNVDAFYSYVSDLFDLILMDSKVHRTLKNVYQRCVSDGDAYKGLANIVLFAILGEKYYMNVIRNENDYTKFKTH